MDENKYRISALPSASRHVEKVHPDQALYEATSRMIMSDYSQLPVMTNDRDVKGIISWKTIGISKQLGTSTQLVKHCMDPNFTVVLHKDNLLKVVKKILEEEFVLVKDETMKICGICTIADIGERFLAQARPFIEIEQIEDSIRGWLVDIADLNFWSTPITTHQAVRKVSDISDLTFGDYVRWFEDKENWASLGKELDRKVFIEELKKVNEIRNRLMHFRQADICENDMLTLRKISKFFRIDRRNQQNHD
jgi:Mg2+/Co2+ transporter CorC